MGVTKRIDEKFLSDDFGSCAFLFGVFSRVLIIWSTLRVSDYAARPGQLAFR